MKTALTAIAALILVALGLFFAALNDGSLAVDLYFIQFQASAGGALIAAAVLGFLLSGFLLWMTVIWPQSRQLANARRALASPKGVVRPEPGDR